MALLFVVETVFPNIRWLLKIYVLIRSSQAVVERGFWKMGQIITKKCTSLDDNSLEMLMRISHHKISLSMNNVKQVLDNLRGQKECRIFSNNL